MWMRHQWQYKADFNAGLSAGSAKNGMGILGIRVVGEGDGWVLGEINGGLILVQAIGVNDGGDSHVIVVAASDDQAAIAACDRLSDNIRGARTL